MTALPIANSPSFKPVSWLGRIFGRRAGTDAPPSWEETCNRRDFVNRLMAEDPSCIGNDHGMAGMMTMYPRDF